jgi:serine/threonine-protein kinase
MDRAGAAGGELVGHYRLQGLIGKGSIGEVHAASDVDSGQTVALKLLRLSGGAGDAREARRLFLIEADAARQLQHPAIVRVFDAGIADGTAWMAMELLAGCDLSRYTRQARLLPESVVMRVIERLARAVSYAHSFGVVHRDLKPANAVVDWSTDRLTLTDFGLARLADAARTRTGLILGSPSYMAPELLAGGMAHAASDLYALGVTLFQLLTGTLPFDDPSMGQLLRRVASEPAPRLHTLRPGLPPGLDLLLAELLAKRPAERPGSASELADRLHRERGLLDDPADTVPDGGANSRG